MTLQELSSSGGAVKLGGLRLLGGKEAVMSLVKKFRSGKEVVMAQEGCGCSGGKETAMSLVHKVGSACSRD